MRSHVFRNTHTHARTHANCFIVVTTTDVLQWHYMMTKMSGGDVKAQNNHTHTHRVNTRTRPLTQTQEGNAHLAAMYKMNHIFAKFTSREYVVLFLKTKKHSVMDCPRSEVISKDVSGIEKILHVL